jgi:hypothetical protein
MDVHVGCYGQGAGPMQSLGVASFAPRSRAWLEENRPPTPEEIGLDRRVLALPGDETVEVAIVLDEGWPAFTLHAFQDGVQFLQLSSEMLHVIVRTPRGTMLSLNAYPDQQRTSSAR